MKSFLCLIILIVCACKEKDRYHEYLPTFASEKGFIECKDSLTNKHRANIQQVFRYYDVPFKVQNGKILYKGEIEKEVLWNFTIKANDTIWLNSHIAR